MEDVDSLLDETFEQTRVISTHEHHMDDSEHAQLTLDHLIDNAYIGLWYGGLANERTETRREWLAKVQYNSYFIWLEKAIRRIYGVGAITAENWDLVSDAIATAHRDPNHHLAILTDHAGYEKWIQDTFWRNGDGLGHEDLAHPVFRIDAWLSGFDPGSRQLDNDPTLALASDAGSLAEYEGILTEQLCEEPGRYVALKCAAAYERSISFEAFDGELAKSTYGKSAELVTSAEKENFENYMFNVVMRAAAEQRIPLQIHTGLAKITGSNPLLLAPVIEQNPEVRFVLFHGGFPWVYETAGLAHTFSNVYLDINWLPIISTSAAATAFATFMEVLPDCRKICWGGDSWTAEESLGALMALQHVIRLYGRQQTKSGVLSATQVSALARAVLRDNAQRLYFDKENER